MKKYFLMLFGGSILFFNLAWAQPISPSTGLPESEKGLGDYVLVRATNSLPKFDLDFAGGTPKDLVKAVEKATGKPLNTVIPDEYADLKIPAVSVKNVTVAQLFDVLTSASKTFRRYDIVDPLTGNGGYSERIFTYGFQTVGVPNENSIWFFYKEGDDPGPFTLRSSTVCKFYQLEPYLEAGYTVEDITTAVKTGWKMLGITKPPEITYHKDTKVLIAVGEEDKVNLIADVLKQLSTTPKEKSNDKNLPKSKDQ
jgi:hypothetical protein